MYKTGSVIRALAGAAIAAALAGAAVAAETAEGKESRANSLMWYRQPARTWSESMPVGNGRLGAMVWGKVSDEIIHLNEETLWSAGPYSQCNSTGGKHIAEVRRLVLARKYAEASALFQQELMGKPAAQMKYQPLGDLVLSFPFEPVITDYRRELDLDTAIAKVEYRAGGVKYTREVFASPVDQVIVVRISADKPGAVELAVRLAGRTNLRKPSGEVFSVERPKGKGEGLVLKGRNADDNGIAGALTYEARLKVIREGGSAKGEDAGQGEQIHIRGANAVTLLIAAATSFVNYHDVSADPAERAERQLEAAAGKSYQQLRDAAAAEHRRLFRRVEVAMTATPDCRRPTDERLRTFAESDDPQLAALIYQYGRYLLICSSRPGTQPANLQGIWNPRMNPSWESKYTTNINVEMNYWPAESGNLAECVEPLEGLIRDVAGGPGIEVARKEYNAGGWVLHQNTDIWRAAAPMDGSFWGTWAMGGAWLCSHLWEHYLYDPNEAYQRKVYPLLKGSAEFFLDTLVEEPQHKWLVTCPSTSPENAPRRPDLSDSNTPGAPRSGSICAGPTMDMQILRNLFGSCIEASEKLGVDADFRKKLAAARARLAPNQVGQYGQLQEWLEDWDNPKDKHRHISHLWGMYPGNEISVAGTPELAKAVAKSLEFRGEGSTGFGSTWQMCIWARMFDGETAFQRLVHEVAKFTHPNLWGDCYGSPQMDSAQGASAGIAEMLLQSQEGDIHFLPALPKAWPDGCVKGMRARGGFEVDFAWKAGKLTGAAVRSKYGRACRVRYGDKTANLSIKPGESCVLDWRLARQ